MKSKFQFGTLTTQPVAVCKPSCKVPATSLTEADVNRAIDWLQEGNNPMCYKTEKTEAQTQRDYLNNRLSQAAVEKNDGFIKTFRINNPDTPNTYKELIDAIKNGKYEIVEKVAGRVDDYVEENDHWFGSPFEGIKWKLDNAPDFDGYRDAEKQAEKARTVAKDAIMSGVYADGLKAIQEFEAWQPEGKAN